jgi:hypothetical protein
VTRWKELICIFCYVDGLCKHSEDIFLGNERHSEISVGVYKSNLETFPNAVSVDLRSISVQDLLQKVGEAICLNENQKKELFLMLINYLRYFTARPGKRTLFEYNFKATLLLLVVRSSRPIPFSLRSAR